MPDALQTLFKAIFEDDRSKVRDLVKQKVDLVKSGAAKAGLEASIVHWIYVGDTALHVAAAGHRVEIVKSLLDAGADVGAAKNHRRSQPLHYAADGYSESPSWDAARQVATIRVLIEAGADLGAQDKNGATPLHRAVRTRCTAATEFLLNAGSDPTLRNKPGSTPFHLAVQNTGRGGSGSTKAKDAQRQIIFAFLDHGVKPTIKDGKGKTVLDWAKSDWIRELLENGNRAVRRSGFPQ